jgi:hypothetical protein
VIAPSTTALARPAAPLAETGLPGCAAAPRVRPGGVALVGSSRLWLPGCRQWRLRSSAQRPERGELGELSRTTSPACPVPEVRHIPVQARSSYHHKGVPYETLSRWPSSSTADPTGRPEGIPRISRHEHRHRHRQHSR